MSQARFIANLNQLTSPNYTHRYYVDAAVTYAPMPSMPQTGIQCSRED